MKHIVLLTGVLIAAVACSKHTPPPLENQGIAINIAASDDFTTRIGGTRATNIYSSDAIQSIDNVFVHVFQSQDGGTTYKFFKTFDLSSAWIKGSNSASKTLARDEMFANGQYRFLAVGIDAANEYTTMPSFVAGTTDYTTIYGQQLVATPDEIFAGTTDRTISASIEKIDVLMQRRVAGVLGYFQNIPTTLNSSTVKYLRLAIVGSTKKFDVTAIGAAPTPNVADEAGYNVFDVDLSTQGDANADGYFDGTPEIGGVSKVAQSTLVGGYIVPVAIASGTTLTLTLVADDGTTVLKTWTVKDDAGNTTYNIVSNHFYSLGRKLQSANTTNGNTDPSDDDLPLDLSKSQTITANISAGWNTTHQMVLQD